MLKTGMYRLLYSAIIVQYMQIHNNKSRNNVTLQGTIVHNVHSCLFSLLHVCGVCLYYFFVNIGPIYTV